jgi:hypothetical protein
MSEITTPKKKYHDDNCMANDVYLDAYFSQNDNLINAVLV